MKRIIHNSVIDWCLFIATEYNQACDWWSVGVILYEMLVGRPPFVAQTALDTQIRVVQWPRHLRIPGEPQLAAAAGDLIRRLLCDPEDRLADPVKLKTHQFFADVNWETLPSQTPPHVPVVSVFEGHQKSAPNI